MASATGSAGGIRAGMAYVEITTKNSLLVTGLKKAQESLRNFANSVQAVGGNFLRMSGMFAVPVALATKTFAAFDDQMRIASTISGATADSLSALTDKARELGATTAFTATQVAEGQVSLARMGFNSDEIKDSIENILYLTRATGEGTYKLGEIALIAGNAMKVFKQDSLDIPKISNTIAYAANHSAMTVGDFGEALRSAGNIAYETHENLKDISAIFMVMANAGTRGEMAGTAYRKMMTKLTEPKIIERIESMGVKVKDLNGNLRKSYDILSDLFPIMAEMGTAEMLQFTEELFDLRGMFAGTNIAQNSEELKKFRKELETTSGYSKETADEMEKGLGGTFRMLMSRVNDACISIGDSVADMYKGYFDAFTNMLKGIREWIDANKPIVSKVMAVAASTTVLGVSLIALGLTIRAVAFAMSPFIVALDLGHKAVVSFCDVTVGLIRIPDRIIKAFNFMSLIMSQTWKKMTPSFTAYVAKLNVGFKQIKTGMSMMATEIWRDIKFISGKFYLLGFSIGNSMKIAYTRIASFNFKRISDQILYFAYDAFRAFVYLETGMASTIQTMNRTLIMFTRVRIMSESMNFVNVMRKLQGMKFPVGEFVHPLRYFTQVITMGYRSTEPFAQSLINLHARFLRLRSVISTSLLLQLTKLKTAFINIGLSISRINFNKITENLLYFVSGMQKAFVMFDTGISKAMLNFSTLTKTVNRGNMMSGALFNLGIISRKMPKGGLPALLNASSAWKETINFSNILSARIANLHAKTGSVSKAFASLRLGFMNLVTSMSRGFVNITRFFVKLPRNIALTIELLRGIISLNRLIIIDSIKLGTISNGMMGIINAMHGIRSGLASISVMGTGLKTAFGGISSIGKTVSTTLATSLKGMLGVLGAVSGKLLIIAGVFTAVFLASKYTIEKIKDGWAKALPSIKAYGKEMANTLVEAFQNVKDAFNMGTTKDGFLMLFKELKLIFLKGVEPLMRPWEKFKVALLVVMEDVSYGLQYGGKLLLQGWEYVCLGIVKAIEWCIDAVGNTIDRGKMWINNMIIHFHQLAKWAKQAGNYTNFLKSKEEREAREKEIEAEYNKKLNEINNENIKLQYNIDNRNNTESNAVKMIRENIAKNAENMADLTREHANTIQAIANQEIGAGQRKIEATEQEIKVLQESIRAYDMQKQMLEEVKKNFENAEQAVANPTTQAGFKKRNKLEISAKEVQAIFNKVGNVAGELERNKRISSLNKTIKEIKKEFDDYTKNVLEDRKVDKEELKHMQGLISKYGSIMYQRTKLQEVTGVAHDINNAKDATQDALNAGPSGAVFGTFYAQEMNNMFARRKAEDRTAENTAEIAKVLHEMNGSLSSAVYAFNMGITQ